MPITHKKVATLPDQPGVEINKGEWNDDHVLPDPLTLNALAAAMYLSVGALPASAGALRLSADEGITSQSAFGGDAIDLLKYSSTNDQIEMGLVYHKGLRAWSISSVNNIATDGDLIGFQVLAGAAGGLGRGIRFLDSTGSFPLAFAYTDATDVLHLSAALLPTTDPANGQSEVWNNLGVLMVGT